MKDTEMTWDAMATDYEGFTAKKGSYSEAIEVPCIESLLPQLRGARVVDLGCGTGRFSFLLEARGAREVIGIDLSSGMLTLAEAKKKPGSCVCFVKSPIQDLGFLESGSVDFIFSSTTLHYLDDLPATLQEIGRVLRPGGRAVLSVMHPVYTSSYPIAGGDGEWKPRYLDRRRRAYIQPWTRMSPDVGKVTCESAHHTFSDYVRAITTAGLLIRGIHEPGPPDSWKGTNPERWRDVMEEPVYAIFDCEKPGDGARIIPT